MSSIVFLIYHPRSGSTYLSKLLHEFREIFVSYEADFTDGISRGRSFDLNKSILSNKKFDSWNVDKTKLLNSSIKTFETFLLTISNELHKGEVFIFKEGKYRFFLQSIYKIFPNAKVIFVSRDPRSIYLSQSSSNSSVTGRPMIEKDPILFSKTFKYIEKEISRNSNQQLLKVRFEDLIENKDIVIDKILRFLDVGYFRDYKDYGVGIDNRQSHLHKNISKKANKARSDSWTSHKEDDEILAINSLCKEFIDKNDYDNIANSRVSFRLRMRYLFMGSFLKYYWTILKIKFQINSSYLS